MRFLGIFKKEHSQTQLENKFGFVAFTTNESPQGFKSLTNCFYDQRQQNFRPYFPR